MSPFELPKGVAIILRAADTKSQVWIRRADNNLWAFPAGKIENGEVPFEAAIREVREETGLVLTDEPKCIGVATAGRWQIALYHVWLPSELPLISSSEGEVEWRVSTPKHSVQAYPGYTEWALWRERIAT